MNDNSNTQDVSIGLKLRSTNLELLDEACLLYKQDLYQYIELYIVPGSFQETCSAWLSSGIPFILHAPHNGNGVNLADASLRVSNKKAYEDVLKFAEYLSSSVIIVHPGNSGNLEEIAFQLNAIRDIRFHLENKPRVGLENEVCHGSLPSEIQWLLSAIGLDKTVLDFGHAIYASRSIGCESEELIRGFMKFNPRVFHLADGSSDSEKDVHINLGDGSFDLEQLISFIPNGSLVTLETPRRHESGLDDYIKDVEIIKSLWGKQLNKGRNNA